MNNRKIFYRISDDIFSRFTGYSRGVVLAYDVKNGDSPPDLVQMLRSEEESLRKRINIVTILDNEKINSWREAYRSFGAKPSKFRPSMEAMARRVLKNNELPSISRLVDIGNIISLRYLVPAGGHSIDFVKNDLSLRFAKGNEIFIPFGSEQSENPEPGEVIFTEGDTVLTRRWTWRQAEHTIITPSTKNIEFNVDGLAPVTIQEVEQICLEVIDLIKQFCGGNFRYEILTDKNPQICISE